MNEKFLDEALIAFDPSNYIVLGFSDNEFEQQILNQTELEISLLFNSTPEEEYIEIETKEKIKEAFLALSSEAKEIVNIIIDCPVELAEICWANNSENDIVLSKFSSLLRKQWGERLRIKKLFKEVTKFGEQIRRIIYENAPA
jgi:hypothetical protein